MQKDSAVGTILVAVLLCIVCSVMVTASAVVLRDKQEKNKLLDIKKPASREWNSKKKIRKSVKRK